MKPNMKIFDSMKRIFAIFAALALAGCSGILDYDFSKIEPELMAVGLLKQGDGTHTVFLSLSRGGLVEPVHDASLKCYVNDRLVAEKSAVYSDCEGVDYTDLIDYGREEDYMQLPLSFDASFNPGDKVRLDFEADGGRYSASSMLLTVPEPVSLTDIDTATVAITKEGWTDVCLQIKAALPDRKNERNWYSIECSKSDSGVFSFKDGGPDIAVKCRRVMFIKYLDDQVLLDGNAAETDLSIFNSLGNGSFATFSDALFADGTAKLKINLHDSWNFESVNFDGLLWKLYSGNDYDEIKERGLDRCAGSQTVDIHLSHCSEATYHYLRALRTISSENYIPEIVEPVTIPCNITGGTGFVDIVSTSTVTLDLPDEELVYMDEL